jgi:hypothetical protein
MLLPDIICCVHRVHAAIRYMENSISGAASSCVLNESSALQTLSLTFERLLHELHEQNSAAWCRPQTHGSHQPRCATPDLGAMSPPGSQKPAPSANASRPLPPVLDQHPDFPRLPRTAPLTYLLAMQVCLASRPEDRLSFSQISRLLQCLLKEVASGMYTDTCGNLQVCGSLLLP